MIEEKAVSALQTGFLLNKASRELIRSDQLWMKAKSGLGFGVSIVIVNPWRPASSLTILNHSWIISVPSFLPHSSVSLVLSLQEKTKMTCGHVLIVFRGLKKNILLTILVYQWI